MFPTKDGTHNCALTLEDPEGLSTSYEASFEVECVTAEETTSKSFEIVVPVPTVTGVSPTGIITVEWNTDME